MSNCGNSARNAPLTHKMYPIQKVEIEVYGIKIIIMFLNMESFPEQYIYFIWSSSTAQTVSHRCVNYDKPAHRHWHSRQARSAIVCVCVPGATWYWMQQTTPSIDLFGDEVQRAQWSVYAQRSSLFTSKLWIQLAAVRSIVPALDSCTLLLATKSSS